MKVLLAVLALATLGWAAAPRETAAAERPCEPDEAACAAESLALDRQQDSHPGWPRWILDAMGAMSPEAFMRALAR